MSEGPVIFTTLYPGKFVEVDGLPFEDGPSEWHVNDHVHLGEGTDVVAGLLRALCGEDVREPDSVVSHAIVLQRQDASEEWFGVVVRDTVRGKSFSHGFHFEGGDEPPEEFNPRGITAEVIEDD